MGRAHWLLPGAPYDSYAAYVAGSGGSAVEKARAMGAQEVIEAIERSGLRGRGGAGFPTGVKWRALHAHECPTRYVVGNAAEGEPGTFKDRMLLRRNPFAFLEGMLVAAEVLSASELYIAIKASFTREIGRLRQALDEMSAAGALGDRSVTIVEGPEEYLFGEEKALLNQIEDGEPLPREAHYPPYERGLFASPGSPNPALVNNVETFAHVATIAVHGADSFRVLGTADTPGTLLFTVSGDVARPGVYELEAGISLRNLLYEIAGGARRARIKAVLPGLSAGVITPEQFETPADFGSLARIGSGLGSAGFVVLDETRSMPRVAQGVARFLFVESCNQCPACKHGLRLSSSALDELFSPTTATADDVDRAVLGARSSPQANRCYLPVQASVLIPSLVERFGDEFAAQAAAPAAPAEPFHAPLIVDFDERDGTFAYDTMHPYKGPDWTYSLPPEELERIAAPAPNDRRHASDRWAAPR